MQQLFWLLGHVETHIIAFTAMALALLFALRCIPGLVTQWAALRWHRTPRLFALGGVIVFVIAVAQGITQAELPLDRAYHDTSYAIACFHDLSARAGAYGVFAAIYLWVSRIAGKGYTELAGRLHFALMSAGTCLTLAGQFAFGSTPRRYVDAADTFRIAPQLSSLGALLWLLSLLIFVATMIYTVLGPKPTA